MALFGGARRLCMKLSLLGGGGYGRHYCTSACKRASSRSSFISGHANPQLGIGSSLRKFTVASSDQLNLIKQLRERTSAPLKDVKAALIDSLWDIGTDSQFFIFWTLLCDLLALCSVLSNFLAWKFDLIWLWLGFEVGSFSLVVVWRFEHWLHNNNAELAHKELRKRGKVLALKRSSRTAAEGLLALAQNENKAAVIELNCETDFVARNEIFQYLVGLAISYLFWCLRNIVNKLSISPSFAIFILSIPH